MSGETSCPGTVQGPAHRCGQRPPARGGRGAPAAAHTAGAACGAACHALLAAPPTLTGRFCRIDSEYVACRAGRNTSSIESVYASLVITKLLRVGWYSRGKRTYISTDSNPHTQPKGRWGCGAPAAGPAAIAHCPRPGTARAHKSRCREPVRLLTGGRTPTQYSPWRATARLDANPPALSISK
ncbi:hypothetical protein BDV35DRAFT_374883 [Aspergillus flavus]|uniref:Uncharacterized protein n=1 Tax=Aspergillus flavus TaxID=5059 RepID=A0A5N6GFN2_ASPFL|nr:hypothetical protein BDV35DRAFT_374883 [Aspergillus flavus]